MTYKIDLTQGHHHQTASQVLRRVLWMVVAAPFFTYLPGQFSPWKVLLLRLFGAKIGRKCLICYGVKVLMPWNLVLGDCVGIGRRVDLYNFSLISVGGMTLISQDAFICTGSHDYTDPALPLSHKPIEIGSECWIASRVFVAPGVLVGSGTVVAACSVLTKSTPPWSVWGGNPAHQIKERKIGNKI